MRHLDILTQKIAALHKNVATSIQSAHLNMKMNLT